MDVTSFVVGDGAVVEAAVRKTPFLSRFMLKSDHFAKTGSGQT